MYFSDSVDLPPGMVPEEPQDQLDALFAARAKLGRGWTMLHELDGLYLAADEAEGMAAHERVADLSADDPASGVLPGGRHLLAWGARRSSLAAGHSRGRSFGAGSDGPASTPLRAGPAPARVTNRCPFVWQNVEPDAA